MFKGLNENIFKYLKTNMASIVEQIDDQSQQRNANY